MKFKVGDYTRIKNTVNGYEFSNGFKIGQIVEVTEIDILNEFEIFVKNEIGEELGFNEEELEKISDEEIKEYRQRYVDNCIMEMHDTRTLSYETACKIMKAFEEEK